jgi:hypothetical protein
MRQGHTEGDLIFQGHACISSRAEQVAVPAVQAHRCGAPV